VAVQVILFHNTFVFDNNEYICPLQVDLYIEHNVHCVIPSSYVGCNNGFC